MKSDEAGGAGDENGIYSRHRSIPSGFCRAIELGFHVENRSLAALEQPRDQRPAFRHVIIVRDREDDGIGGLERLDRRKRNSIFCFRLIRRRQRIVHLRLHAGAIEFAHDIDDLGVADVRHILLERHAEDGDQSG